jgi:hypothetical protein
VQGLAELVHTGQVRYVVVAGLRMGGRSVAAKDRDAWIAGHCRSVPGLGTGTASVRGTGTGTGTGKSTGLFDCS